MKKRKIVYDAWCEFCGCNEYCDVLIHTTNASEDAYFCISGLKHWNIPPDTYAIRLGFSLYNYTVAERLQYREAQPWVRCLIDKLWDAGEDINNADIVYWWPEVWIK